MSADAFDYAVLRRRLETRERVRRELVRAGLVDAERGRLEEARIESDRRWARNAAKCARRARRRELARARDVNRRQLTLIQVHRSIELEPLLRGELLAAMAAVLSRPADPIDAVESEKSPGRAA